MALSLSCAAHDICAHHTQNVQVCAPSSRDLDMEESLTGKVIFPVDQMLAFLDQNPG